MNKRQKAHYSVSEATIRNWHKLGVSTTVGKLVSRANKKLSTARIIPVEYFDNKLNISNIATIAEKLVGKYSDIGSVLFTLGLKLLEKNKIITGVNIAKNPIIHKFINNCPYTYITELNIDDFPQDESDLLGLIYQSLLQEGIKNTQGSYYTPKNVVRDMVCDIQLTTAHKVLDPCCGSLVYLLNIPNIKPDNIYATDIDPIAVMIAQFNYFLKFPEAKFVNIFNADFLIQDREELRCKFDYVITNPPWGASSANTKKYPEVLSGETFSCFVVEAHKSLKKSGQIRLLLPESILNVKIHRDIRHYLLSTSDLIAIKMYTNLFSGVTTKYVAITANYSGNTREVIINVADRSWSVEKKVYKTNLNYIFRLSELIDELIIAKVFKQKQYDLNNSLWALGIVTGNNQQKLSIKARSDREKIYTGKEIVPYKLKPAKYYIKYHRSQLQQVAKDEIYRATPKLVYKFIAKKLVFAVDETSALFLNSANILVPNIPNMSVKSVVAFLNSELYQYLYMKLFREVKILKGNLLQIPFPKIDSKTDKMICDRVDNIISGKSDDKSLQDFIYSYYQISFNEIKRIKQEVYGTIDKSTKSRY